MKKYEKIEIEITEIDVEDIITTSRTNTETDGPIIDIDPGLINP